MCECPTCFGSGTDPFAFGYEGVRIPCLTCGGTGIVREEDEENFALEAFIREADSIITLEDLAQNFE